MQSERDILVKISKDPKLLWKILTTKHKLLGPWQINKAYRCDGDGVIRWSYDGASASIEALKSFKLTKPEEYDYYIMGGVDWEELEEANKIWEKEKLIWKEWEYRFSDDPKYRFTNSDEPKYHEYYADTKEEAIKLADKLAKSEGYLLYDGE